MKTITARHAGVCRSCGHTFDVGTELTHDDALGWVHVECPDVPTKYDFDPDDVCGECFTVRSVNGACACPN